MTMVFEDSSGRKISVERKVYEKKVLWKRNKTFHRVRLTVGKEWAEFETSELTKNFFEGQAIAESFDSSNGPVFIANVDWAPESSLFEKQVMGVPKRWWVVCFMNLSVEPVQAAFSPEDFDSFLKQISVEQ